MKWNFLYQITAASRTPTRGLPPPDPRSLCPLSSTEFVKPPSHKQNSWESHWNESSFMHRHKFWFILRGRMSVSVIITRFIGFPSLRSLDNTYLSQWTKQLNLKAAHLHIVLRLRIHGTFLHCHCTHSWHYALAQVYHNFFLIISNCHYCGQAVLYLLKINCGEKMMKL